MASLRVFSSEVSKRSFRVVETTPAAAEEDGDALSGSAAEQVRNDS